MPYHRPEPDSFIEILHHESPHKLTFKGAVKILQIARVELAGGEPIINYTVEIKPRRTVLSRYLNLYPDIPKEPIELTAPCLEEFGHNLQAGTTYIVRGLIEYDHFDGMTWQINPLLARARSPVLCGYLINRMIVIGVRRVTDVIETTDKEDTVIAQHKLIINIRLQDTPIGVNLRLVMTHSDAPVQLRGGYMPGVEVRFRGYLTAPEKADKIMRVEVIQHGPPYHA
ncbi:hypothetical protein PTTG_28868 [Puccinia triticina 1-1 BBBD Race 1]|uniref:Uncharacterized protein n=1 Tax=Puccinia triticina (isolate 1-1 / race 1 (BBBD)) TaxID=630390 RepID=A0A180G8Y3_PUCT1|nr:hypothetical protein PTTG_28868 [Puccinia triticina 1-1 BBBD Race 1]